MVYSSQLICLFATLFTVLASPAQSFSTKDKLIILVTGTPLTTSLFGYSGKASMYQAVGVASDGSLQFSPVIGAQQIDLERNSAKDFTNLSNYGTNGFIPPGVYFLHYHRLDASLGQVRHRLGLSDVPGGETILSDTASPPVVRTALQFHKAFNDLGSFNAHVSEGCMTLTEANFYRLFPPIFFTPQSPLQVGASDPNPLGFLGATNNILVFVTDTQTAGRQEKELKAFDALRKKLTTADFSAAKIGTIRAMWRLQ